MKQGNYIIVFGLDCYNVLERFSTAGIGLVTGLGVDFINPIYTLRQAFMLCAILYAIKKPLKKFGAEHKMALPQLLAFMKSTPEKFKMEPKTKYKAKPC